MDPSKLSRSHTPRTIVPQGDASRAVDGDDWRSRDDYKRTLTTRYLEDQAIVEDDGYVPASECAEEEEEESERWSERASDRADEDNAKDEKSTMRLTGTARSGECLEVIVWDRLGAETTLRWQRVTPLGGVELVENARGTRYVCQDVDVGCFLRVVRYNGRDREMETLITDTAVVAVEYQEESQLEKRKEVVLPAVPLGPASEAHRLYLQGKMLEASSRDHAHDIEMSEEQAKEALKCYVLAAKDRYMPAYSSIGRLYELGIGVEVDYEQARGWYKEGVKEGCAVCNNNLGSLEYLELGIGADRELAPKYFKVAAEKGNPAAMNNLAVCYEEGIGVAQDFREAKRYYEMAVRGGVMSAFASLGYAEIVNGDLEEALDAFHAGLESGSQDAKDGIELLSAISLTPQPMASVESTQNATIDLLQLEIDQYADLATKLYDLIMSGYDSSLKRQAKQLTQEAFAS